MEHVGIGGGRLPLLQARPAHGTQRPRHAAWGKRRERCVKTTVWPLHRLLLVLNVVDIWIRTPYATLGHE